MPLGPERLLVTIPIGAITATTEYCGWTNKLTTSIDVYEVESATVNLLATITGTTNSWWSFRLHHVNTSGTHTTVIGTKTYSTGVDHTAYIADSLTLASTGLQIKPGEGINASIVKVGIGTLTTLSADTKMQLVLVKGKSSVA